MPAPILRQGLLPRVILLIRDSTVRNGFLERLRPLCRPDGVVTAQKLPRGVVHESDIDRAITYIGREGGDVQLVIADFAPPNAPPGILELAAWVVRFHPYTIRLIVLPGNIGADFIRKEVREWETCLRARRGRNSAFRIDFFNNPRTDEDFTDIMTFIREIFAEAMGR